MVDSKSFEWLKSTEKHALGFLIATSVLLFPPETIINKLGLFNIRESVKPWIGAVWLFSLACVLSNLIRPITDEIKIKINMFIRINNDKKILRNLSADEKIFIQKYLKDDTKTQAAPYANGVATGLVRQGVIFMPSNMAVYGDRFAFNIQPWALAYLKKHPEILG